MLTSDELDDLDAPAAPTTTAAAARGTGAAATVAYADDDDDDDALDRELGISTAPRAAAVVAPPSESMAVPMGADDADGDDQQQQQGVEDVAAAAVSAASSWIGGLWTAASSAVATAAVNVQRNPEIHRAIDAARHGAQQAMSSIDTERLRSTVANVTEAARHTARDVSTAVEKLIDMVDPLTVDPADLFDVDEYDRRDAIGKVKVLVTSANPAHVAAAVDVFERVHGPDAVYAKGAPTESAVAKQPVGFEAGVKGAKARIETALQTTPKLREEGFTIVGLESFIVKVGETWLEATAVALYDTKTNVGMHTFSQTTEVDGDVVRKCLELTPATYVRRDTGFSVTVASIIALSSSAAAGGEAADESNWHAVHQDHRLSLQQIVATALLGLYGRYWRHLQQHNLVSLKGSAGPAAAAASPAPAPSSP